MMSIERLLLDRAAELAAHDGAPAARPIDIHGAAHQLLVELLAARDRLMSPPAPTPAAAEAPAEPELAPESAPGSDPAAVPDKPRGRKKAPTEEPQP